MAFEMHYYRQLIEITWRHWITVRQKLRDLIGEYEKLLTVARRRILQWFGITECVRDTEDWLKWRKVVKSPKVPQQLTKVT